MPNIIIYTQPACRYCERAKELLQHKQQNFQEVDVTVSSEIRQEMVAKSGGRNTTPQIFIKGKHIGGCDDLFSLDQSGELDKIIAGK